MRGYCVVLITAPVDKAETIAEEIINKKWGACVNTVMEISSIYWWKGKIERDKEALLVVKTSLDKLGELTEGVKSVHPYTVPEIIALPIIGGNEDYLNWIEDSLR